MGVHKKGDSIAYRSGTKETERWGARRREGTPIYTRAIAETPPDLLRIHSVAWLCHVTTDSIVTGVLI
jgi:hypothetical protein